MFTAYILRDIKLHQGIRQMLTAIPEVIFLIGVERDDYGSGMVDVGAAFWGHIYWLSFLFSFIGNISVREYIENNGQGQKEKELGMYPCCLPKKAYIILYSHYY